MDEVREVIVVEGRYDKHTVTGAVRATVIETRGFGIFSDGEKVQLIRRLARERGVIILTDSDSAGFLIRNHLKGQLPEGQVKHAYIPDRPGKERRKRKPGSEGKLGVEGMDRQVIIDCLRRAGATFVGGGDTPGREGPNITKAHLYAAGLSGKEESSAKRRALLHQLDLPENLTANGLIEVLNILFTYEDALRLLSL